ncbi:hypothetical protein HYH03_013482 [Edaphochlamys debaryana]|uniref:Mediator of RNA polymerase II transcription subunit 14 n=1 Tax=Edaphochlamys debaryana TaxID=47281 RepID=A0A836BTA2_9CHLO|nr:hypothetical protein HYH03_013482 [Edaphochlamys debaryana]|eukprot:KAG2487902.1 hypothetical protein HYH03_013482 [Edaphochlamys debaryana]
MDELPPLRGAQSLVDLQSLLCNVFDNVLADFIQLTGTDAGALDPEARKQRLLQHLHASRQQLLRCLVVLNWKPWKVLGELVDHDRVADVAAGHVRTMAEVVGGMRQQAAGRIMAGVYLNMYDVNTALEVLTTGTYRELPSIILHRPPLFQPPPASMARQRSRLAHVTHLIRARLVQVALPPGLKVVSVSNGTAVLRAEGLYEAKLTLVPSEPLMGADGSTSDEPGGGAGPSTAGGGGSGPDWAAAAAASAASDPVAAEAAGQRWKWRLIAFVLCIGVPFYDPRQPGQILNTVNFHMVLAADNAAYLKRQRGPSGIIGGGGAAANAAAPAPSESAATPAPSGLAAAAGGGAGGAGGGAGGGSGGGSLAAAIRKVEDDEVGSPLAVMHAILTDVAGRLLADELAAAARALAAPGSRWHGHISVRPSTLLSPGVRIEYWINSPPLIAPRALPAPPTAGTGAGAAEPPDYKHVKPGPPFLELGMGEGGCVEVLNAPTSLHAPAAVSKLKLDTFRVNVEEVLMRAANMSAMFQLLQVRGELQYNLKNTMGARAPTTRLVSLARQLWSRDGAPLPPPPGLGDDGDDPTSRGGGGGGGAATQPASPAAGPGGGAAMDVDTGAGSAAATAAAAGPLPPPTVPVPEVAGPLTQAAPPEESAGAVVVLNAPVLECLVTGTTELKVCKHLYSGRLMLRPGQDERDEGSLDHAASVAASEDAVNSAAAHAYAATSQGDAYAYPAYRALREACAALCRVLQRTHTSTDATHFIQAARRASLHISRLPQGLLEAFTAANPGLALEPSPAAQGAGGRGAGGGGGPSRREDVPTWALQCLPFPSNFPPLEPLLQDTPALRVPQCLTFFLQSRLSLTSQHVLVVCACNRQLMPLKVVSCIPVPPSTYRLPDHVVAAFMAAAAAGSGGADTRGTAGGAAPGTGAAASGVHGPHSGGSSPRATPAAAAAAGNGPTAEPMGRSPESSPVRDLVAAGLIGRHSVGGGLTISDGGAVPSLPYAASPPPPAAPAPAHGPGTGSTARGASTGGALLAAAAVGSGSPPAAASQSRSGRPTGQQVAVMLAQQQLSSVVRWCRRRMVWEVLLVQLSAVGAAFEALEDVTSPTSHRVRITRVAGTALPCPIVRRHGLAPSHVGPTALVLELGPDALAGQITARLYGRFLCAPSCAPVAGGTDGMAAAEEAADGPSGAGAVGAGFVLQGPAPAGAATLAAAGGGGGSGGGLVCLRRQYCLERGDSALTIVQEVAAIIRMQTLLARLEMTVPKAQTGAGAPQLAVLTAPAPAAAAGAGGAARPLGPHNLNTHVSWRTAAQSSPDQPAKRAKIEPGPGAGPPGPIPGPHGPDGTNANGISAWSDGAGGGGAYGNGATAHSGRGGPSATSGGGCLTWHWPLVGTLTLRHYSCSAAMLSYTPHAASAPLPAAPHQVAAAGGSDGGAGAAAAAMLPPPLHLHLTWAPRDVRHLHGSAAAGAAPPPPTPGGAATPAAAAFGGAHPAASSSSSAYPLGTPAVKPSSSAAGAGGGGGGAGGEGAARAGPPLLPLEAVVTSTRTVISRPGEPYGNVWADLVLCTATCSSGHCLPSDYLHVLEEYAEAGEEGKLLDALAVAAWPMAGFCSALRPAVLTRHGLVADVDVRHVHNQPPYCHRIVCRRRAPGGGHSHVLVDLMSQAVGRSYLKISVPSPPGAAAAPDAADDAGGSHSAVLQSVQQLASARLGTGVHVTVGGSTAVYRGLGQRPAALPGLGAPLWLLVPNDSVQAAVELVFSVLNL